MTDASRSGDDQLDRELIERWRAGDQRAATALVERHAPAVTRFVAASGGRDDVEEIVQDTFVRAFGSLESFRGESTLRTWLFTIARRLLLDRRRSARRRPEQVDVGETDAASEFDALDSMVADETQQRLQHAVARLTPMQKQVFALRVGEGLSYKEIAEAVGSTEGAARVHYHNAMRAVKEFLDE